MIMGYMDDFFEDRISIKQDIMYKVLDRDDSDCQGLFKRANTLLIDKKGMLVELKHALEKSDILLVEIFFEEECELVKACCEVVSCVDDGNGRFLTRLDFIIIKESYRIFWEDFIMKRMEM
ncbi:MAG TPA: hypothetical protein P5511_09675, partial [Candidatus Goldiibacteriota bacterium]|nr:hypothetical protein [Candidatus Goldiibacteriota bacterium]